MILIDISFIFVQTKFFEKGLYSQNLEILGVKKLIIFNSNSVEGAKEPFYYFISLQILLREWKA